MTAPVKKLLKFIFHRWLFLILSIIVGLASLNSHIAFSAEIPVKQRDYLTIAVKDNLRPLGFKDANGNLQGLEIDLAQRLAPDLLGKPNAVKLQPVNNSDRLPLVINHQVDLAIARVTATASRSRIVSLSVPYYMDGEGIVTKDTSIQKLQDLTNRKIAVLRDSSTIAPIRYYLPSAELVGVNSYLEGWELTENNRVAAFAADISVLSGWVQENPEYRILPTKLSTQPLSVVTPKGLQYDELRRKINEAIASYIASGWLKQRVEYWGLDRSQLPVTSYQLPVVSDQLSVTSEQLSVTKS